MHQHSTYRVGGAARYGARVSTVDELRAVIAFAAEKKIPWRVIGGGSNLLVRDEGYEGVIIWFTNRHITVDAERGVVSAGAGALTAAVAAASAHAGLTGFEWAAGIPGTMGGAVYGNAGASGGEMKDVVTEVQYFENGAIHTAHTSACGFGYRHSWFKNRGCVIMSATLTLTPTRDAAACQKKLRDALIYRNQTQPKGLSSCGCVFKNFEHAGARVSAGKLIDEAGLKGARRGGAEISSVHGNFIVNRGDASASDILHLIEQTRAAVEKHSGIHLTEEITIL